MHERWTHNRLFSWMGANCTIDEHCSVSKNTIAAGPSSSSSSSSSTPASALLPRLPSKDLGPEGAGCGRAFTTDSSKPNSPHAEDPAQDGALRGRAGSKDYSETSPAAKIIPKRRLSKAAASPITDASESPPAAETKASQDATSTNEPAAAACESSSTAENQDDAPKSARKTAHRQLKRVESKDERDFVKQWDIKTRLLNDLRGSMLSPRNDSKADEPPDSFRRAGEDSSYAGFTLDFPITFKDAETLRAHYCSIDHAKLLQPRVAAELLSQFIESYARHHPSAVVMAGVPETLPDHPGRFVVVGDTHGQLQDVLHIFHAHGPPTARNVYLFNGDIADRGSNAVEIYLMLFAYFLADPRSVMINRGNHESEEMNANEADCGGGFRDEVLGKYGQEMYSRFSAMMKVLQLCTVINKEVFVVHGGLPQKGNLTLEFIKSIDHTEFTMPEPHPHVEQERVWNDLIWSDPGTKPGCTENRRGCGVIFGPDVTDNFLKRNPPLKQIVRSHELPEHKRGYMTHHDGKVITLFSASNYTGNSGNQGAIMVFTSTDFPKFTFHEHYAPSLDTIAQLVGQGKDQWAKEGDLLKDREKDEIDKSWWPQELNKLMVSIVEMKPKIWAHYVEVAKGVSFIDHDTWVKILSEAVGESWHWETAWQSWKLGEVVGGKVHFRKFLSRFNARLANDDLMSFKYRMIARVYEGILHSHASLEETFKRFDVNGDGAVDMEEFRTCLNSFDLGITAAQVDSLLHVIFSGTEDAEDIPRLPVKAFLGRFTMVYKHAEDALTAGDRSDEQRLAHEMMSKIGQLVLVTPMDEIKRSVEAAKHMPSPSRSESKVSNGSRLRMPTRDDVARRIPTKDSLSRPSSPASRAAKDDAGSKTPTSSSRAGRGPSKEDTSRSHSDSKDDAGSKTPTSSSRAGRRPSKDATNGDSVNKPANSGDGEAQKPTKKKKEKGASKVGEKIEKLFEVLDSDQSGMIEIQEFTLGILALPGIKDILLSNGERFTDAKVRDLAKLIAGGDGVISVMELMEAFCYEDSKGEGMADSLAEHMLTVLFRHRLAIRAGARYFDPKSTGMISVKEFEQVLQALSRAVEEEGLQLSKSQIHDLGEAVANECSNVKYDEFFQAFEVSDVENPIMCVKLASHQSRSPPPAPKPK